jgi:hypothetical protein
MVGWWSYAVPEFEVTHYPVPKGFCLERETLARHHDVVVWEDGKSTGTFVGRGHLPVFYHITDSTLSDDHYQHRRQQARYVDALLVDWDRLARFRDLGLPVARFGYCVNDNLMRDYGMGKDIDDGSYQGGTPERRALEEWLRNFCHAHGYNFQSGVYAGQDYPLMMTRSKIVVNVNRNAQTRGHRVFDAMACRACVVTSPLPPVSGEARRADVDYLEFNPDDKQRLAELLTWLLESGTWETFAGNGYMLVRECHTWQVRAAQLLDTMEGIRDAFH